MSDFVALFVLCYIAHKIGDYWVQTDWQAQNKATSARALWMHAGTYTLTFAPLLAAAAAMDVIPTWAVPALLTSVLLPHAWFDTRKPINWFWVRVKKLSLDPASHPLFAVLRLEMDQAFHYTCLAATAAMGASL